MLGMYFGEHEYFFSFAWKIALYEQSNQTPYFKSSLYHNIVSNVSYFWTEFGAVQAQIMPMLQ